MKVKDRLSKLAAGGGSEGSEESSEEDEPADPNIVKASRKKKREDVRNATLPNFPSVDEHWCCS